VLLDDRASGVLLAAFGGAIVLMARTFPDVSGQTIGPALFPTIVGTVLLFLGLALVIGARANRAAPVRLDANMRRPRMAANFALVVLALIGYALIVNTLGFFLTASLLLLVLFSAFKVPIGRGLAVAAVVPLLIHYMFYTVLRVPLPWGLLQSVAW
jgi:putative tricarboxylic transport membrane protein